ncbi:MAG: ATP-binding cassette domain-containing protein [Candidatus Woesearchaeota archaeon]|jgi:energy-coupling factor transport system ATP-binding protein|nr:ATP-binding cassette domain-containing protein [Candidatus Woesearchaeota archaeon]MDP7458446.1 ATP-binding cassette domain-containing protein [Candidatus Woesearchaeota archaeon]
MIQISNISYKYEDALILKDINLNIKEKDFLAIIGHNGSGKTTLIKHINGLLTPLKGTVTVDNLNTKNNDWEIKQKVGIVFQNPEDQLISSIVEEDIAFGLENLNIPSNEIQDKVKNILKKLNIEHLAKKNVNNLSFGQKQLVALAGVLVMRPKYIIFDEPTTVLDPKNKSNILKTMDELNKEGITIILITNNLADIEKYVKDIVLLKKGEIIFNNKKEKLTKDILKEADMHE